MINAKGQTRSPLTLFWLDILVKCSKKTFLTTLAKKRLSEVTPLSGGFNYIKMHFQPGKLVYALFKFASSFGWSLSSVSFTALHWFSCKIIIRLHRDRSRGKTRKPSKTLHQGATLPRCVRIFQMRTPFLPKSEFWAHEALGLISYQKIFTWGHVICFFSSAKKSHFYEKFRCQLGRIFFHTKNFDGRNFFRTWGHNLKKKIKIKLPSSYENSFKSISESSENAVRCF